MTDHLDQSAKDCIAACNDCATACGHCFTHMVGKASTNACPACCIECAAICRLCADAIARHSPFAKQLAELLGEWTVAGDRVGAQPADRRALDAASGTRVGAGLADHVRETVAARGRAVVARGDTVLGALVQMISHGVSPSVGSLQTACFG